MDAPDPISPAPPRITPPTPGDRPFGFDSTSGSATTLRRIKSGPLAAAVATALVLGLTAIPSGGVSTSEHGAPSSLPRATLAVGSILDLPDLAPFDLGDGLGAFVLDESVVWMDRFDGASALSLSLRSERDPTATLAGKLLLRDAESITVLEREVVVADPEPMLGFDPLRVLAPADRTDDGSLGYLSLRGELEGGGALAGTRIVVRNVPGGVVRRGPWRLDDDHREIESVFARLLWLREEGGGVALPRHGSGTLALHLEPSM